MTAQITVTEGGVPHNKVMIYGLVGSLIAIYLTYLNTLMGTQAFSFFGGLGAIAALIWGSSTIKRLCSYGIGTGVPSAGMLAFGSGVIGMLMATKFGMLTPVLALIIAAIVGAILGFISNNILNMRIPVMIQSLTELAAVGSLVLLGFSAMAAGGFSMAALTTGTMTVLGTQVAAYNASLIGGSVLAVLFMLGAIALQHGFNACLGPNEKQDRTLMLTAECGFLSMIMVAIISFAFIGIGAAVLSLLISLLGWYYTYTQFFALSRRDAAAWLDSKPILEVESEA
ncbi:tetrahydromethanopterin S-methyltransferase subunit MtrC [Methanosphaerula subterraneus]|uniref:tetrahydromethanopterin S-methyltransferase subunit MtrC n=1 Tax=Methanosphaerula subterraneus TaxID=3350244 RepID=UPI003F847692